jgi:hypothetical protein
VSHRAAFASLLSMALAIAAGGSLTFQPASAMEQERRLVDRVVAVVNEEPILLSDLERVLALEWVQPLEGESDTDLRRRALAELIEQRLRFQEVDRYGFQEIPVAALEEQVAALRERFGSAEVLDRRLADLGMNEESLRHLLARQLQVLIYVEELLGARVFVGLEEIQRYYEQDLVPRLEESGEEAPPLEAVRESIREVLRQQRLNEELARWTEGLRRRADVVDHLDRPERELPPLVAR